MDRRQGTDGEVKLARRATAAGPPDEASLKTLKNWIAVIIAIVIAYQIATLGRQGLWYDEIFTVMVTRPDESLTEIFQKYLLPESTPPLYYILMHFWQLAAPRGDWSMRVPGLYFYILTIAAAALYPCRAMNTAKRITFVALMGCSFGTVYFAQEVRGYELFGLLAICILYDMLDFATVLDSGREPSWIHLGWSAAVGLATSYTHVFGFLFFGAAVIALIGYGIARGQIPWRIVLLGSVVFGGFIPWMVIQFSLPLNPWITDRPIGVLRGFLRHLVGSPFAAALIAILGLWAVLSRTRAVLVNRNLGLILAAIGVNLVVSVLTYFHTPILDERHLTGVRMATLLGFALVIVEILSDRRAQALLIATAVALFVSFILTEKPKASWREPAAYVIKNTRCDRREILVYYQNLPPWFLSYYLSDERFVLKGSPFDSGVVQELGRLNETRPGCDVVAIALNLNPKNPADREAALAATPFRGPGFHLQEWPSSFVVRRINP
jgi:mannosyltransferase